MPNWCTNRLIVRGTSDEVARFASAAAGVDPNGVPVPLDFNRILPVPDRVREEGWPEPFQLLDELERLPTLESQQSFVAEHPEVVPFVGSSSRDRLPGAVHWQTHHWGTKWAPTRDDFTRVEIGPTEAIFEFSTAWAPPVGIVEACRRRFPTLRFDLTYSEPDGGFAGRDTFSGDGHEHRTVEDPDEAARLLEAAGWPEEADAWRER